MDLDNFGSILFNTGLIFTSCGILYEIKTTEKKLSRCFKTNLNLASIMIMSSSAISIYSKFKHL
jgi:hypothetical protein